MTMISDVKANEKQWKCEVCGKGFRFASQLKKHKKIHGNEKEYQCDVCKKQFRQLSNLKTHRKIHTGEKNYNCSVCKKAFRQAIHLKVHEKIHYGEKEFKCNLCNQTFRQSTHLQKHQQKHEKVELNVRDKPIVRNERDNCSRKFIDNSTKNSKQKMRHKDLDIEKLHSAKFTSMVEDLFATHILIKQIISFAGL